MPSKGAANESRCRCFKNSINLSLSFPNNNKKALRCIPTAKGFHNMDRSSRKPSRMTLLPLNPLIWRIKGDHATVIKLLSKEPLRSRKTLILLGFPVFVSHSHSMVALGLGVTSQRTRLTWGTSVVMRLTSFWTKAKFSSAGWAVTASTVLTARMTTGQS